MEGKQIRGIRICMFKYTQQFHNGHVSCKSLPFLPQPLGCASNVAVSKNRTSIITPILFWPTKVWYVAQTNGAGVEFGVLFGGVE